MATAPINATLVLPLSAQLSPEQEILSLFDTSRDSLLRYAISFGLPVHDAEDIVQEMFLALFHHLRRGRSRSNLRGWTFRVTHNLALKRRARIHSDLRRAEDDLAPADRSCDHNPETQLLLDERQQKLLAVFRALPPNDQRCLQLRAEGLTYREIAGATRMSLGSVSTSLTRSLARLARAEANA